MTKAGGGINSRQHKSVGVRIGAPRQGKNVKAVSQIGQNLGNHSTNRRQMMPERKVVERVKGPQGISVELGNARAAATKCGPGGSRDIYRSGYQSQHGPVAGTAKPQGADILSQYGPDFRSRGSR
jgi:hypothetical protein